MSLTIAQISEMLKKADEQEYGALERSLAADTRKGVVKALASARKRLDAERRERERLEGLYRFEREVAGSDDAVIVGLDEVGRGSVAGPLAVGAVVLPAQPRIAGLDDSKRIAPEQRSLIAADIKNLAVCYAIEYVEPAYIDAHGMTAALRKAFSGALAQVEDAGVAVDVVLVDGNPLGIDEREVNVVKGDGKCASIAAASILAKSERDALMREKAPEYPEYGFDVNKGYASPGHIEAIRTYGTSQYHRESFCRSFMQETLF